MAPGMYLSVCVTIASISLPPPTPPATWPLHQASISDTEPASFHLTFMCPVTWYRIMCPVTWYRMAIPLEVEGAPWPPNQSAAASPTHCRLETGDQRPGSVADFINLDAAAVMGSGIVIQPYSNYKGAAFRNSTEVSVAACGGTCEKTLSCNVFTFCSTIPGCSDGNDQI
jgi:hypothetical protein